MQYETFDKIQHPFMIKGLKKLGIERMYLNIIKAMQTYNQLARKGGKMEPFLLKSGMKQVRPLSQLFFNVVLELLDRTISQEK
jgi:hypothetical protein